MHALVDVLKQGRCSVSRGRTSYQRLSLANSYNYGDIGGSSQTAFAPGLSPVAMRSTCSLRAAVEPTASPHGGPVAQQWIYESRRGPNSETPACTSNSVAQLPVALKGCFRRGGELAGELPRAPVAQVDRAQDS